MKFASQPFSGLTEAFPSQKDLPSPTGKPPTHLEPIKKYKGDDKTSVKKLHLDLEDLTKIEISHYRNSFYQNLSLDMLSMGYHRAFSELYHLVDKQEKERQKAGPDSILWNMSSISMQEEKLNLLKECLSAVEDCYRIDDFRGMHESYLKLAKFFQDYPEDKWLVDHFLKYSWTVSKKIDDDDHLNHAEANYYIGLAMEQNKDFEDAFQYFHTLYMLSKNKTWKIDDNKQIFFESCEHLSTIRLDMAERLMDNTNTDELTQKINYLREALDYSKESENKKLEGKCSYKLGMAYLDADKSEIAINYLLQYYNLSKSINDDESLCIACDALAKVSRKQKKFEDCIRYLEEFADTAEKTAQKEEHSRACRALGDLYNHLGEFSKASGYFSKSFGISRGINDTATVDEARVFFGVSQGNSINLTYNDHIHSLTKTAFQKILQWKKDCKVDSFGIASSISDKQTDTLAQRSPNRNISEQI